MSKKAESKISILGLSNSGKSSIVLSLKKNTNLLNFLSLSPTKGISMNRIIEEFTDFIIWDFGGQKLYIDKYLQNFDEKLHGSNKIIFVLDIQDEEKYDLALEYFDWIMEALVRLNYSSKISFFLHKFDPEIEETGKIDEHRIKELEEKIFKIIPEGFSCNLFKTSIFTVFRKVKRTEINK